MTYDDGVERYYTKEELEDTNHTITTNGILYIPSNYNSIETSGGATSLIYNAKQGIFIGADFSLQANSNINLIACEGPIEINGINVESGTGNAANKFLAKSGKYISATDVTINVRENIEFIAVEEINVSNSTLTLGNTEPPHNCICLKVSSGGMIIDDGLNYNKDPDRDFGNNFVCP